MSSEHVLSGSPASANYRLLLTWFVLLAALATILGAWGFQLIGGYIPCQLCYGQRIPYYVGIPVALLALVAMMTGRVGLARLLLLVVAGIFVWSVYLGAFHAGVEWEWWEGPASCAGGTVGGERVGGNLLDQLSQGKTVVSCTEASWRFPGDWGLSFAGWNAVISTVIVAAALTAAAMRPRRPA